MPSPFNEVADLVKWSGFTDGAATGQEGIRQGTFLFGQFQDALQFARDEIYAKTNGKGNDEFSEGRRSRLALAELYLAVAELYPWFGSRMMISKADADIANIGPLSRGADTPNPLEKSKHYMEFMQSLMRTRGLAILCENTWGMDVGREPERSLSRCSCCHDCNGGPCWGVYL